MFPKRDPRCPPIRPGLLLGLLGEGRRLPRVGELQDLAGASVSELTRGHVHVRLYMYMYIGICLHICIHINMYMCTCAYTHIHISHVHT